MLMHSLSVPNTAANFVTTFYNALIRPTVKEDKVNSNHLMGILTVTSL